MFEGRRQLLGPYAPEAHVSAENGTSYGLEIARPEERNPTAWFAAVRRGKRFLRIELMPVSVEPTLLGAASPDLRGRMQGTSCFSLTRADEPRIGELDGVLRHGNEATAGNPTLAHRRALTS